ncbi:hypothetical protein B0H66DRAFT_398309 [Apodospora peruviana]|uniref:COP9 signalosome complex subunit 6 n=1 Tax=Apodospora peruviana TaxID=516989 RepID=A0AAE0LYK1_9PEZI|nr:hypothetical protein B0H66DRAFT_398309 [Apodospora peruviana]
MAIESVNALISAQKAPGSGLQVALHPLPILEISDYITRSYQRGYRGAIVGALIGQQNGREITIEHSFTCKSQKNDQGLYELDEAWFLARLEQVRLVHKVPLLDLVGWYALVPKTGPTALHLPIHRQIVAQNESAILLGFHIDDLLKPAAGDPLPITIYESNMEAADENENVVTSAQSGEGEDKEMKDPDEPAAGPTTKMVLKFRELPYTTETGEAEMIAMQFIREGGANAYTVVDDINEKRILEQFEKKIAVDGDGKGKRRAVTSPEESSKSDQQPAAAVASKDANLTKPESEYMSALQAKFNAIKMMKSRVDLVVAYLEKLPPDFVEGQQTAAEAAEFAKVSDGKFTVPSNNILRQIQALVTNIELATPAQQATLEREILQETNDVNLISLIADLVSSVSDVREVGKKFAVVESARNQKARNNVASAQFDLADYGGVGSGRGAAVELL